MRGKFTRTASLSLASFSPRPPRIPRWTRADSEHDDRRPRYLIRLLMRTIYVQCPCLMIQELLWPGQFDRRRCSIWIILGTGGGWWIDDEFVFELWIMIISTTCPFLSSGTHLEEGCSKWSNLSR